MKTPSLINLFNEIKLEQIVEMIKFDMNNAWFLLGDSLIGKQKEGISIGGFLSSMLAIMLANYAEHISITASLYSHKFLYEKAQIINGVRATDDGLIIVVLNKLWPKTFLKALHILKRFKQEFVHNMGGRTVLEFDRVAMEYTYLEILIVNVHSDLLILFQNKNLEFFKNKGMQKIIKGAHRDSATASSIKINSLMQTFMRVNIGCSLDVLAKVCSLKFVYEVIRGYNWPLEWISQSLYAVSNHTSQNKEFWRDFITMIEKCVMKHDGSPKLSKKALYDVLESIVEREKTQVRNMIQSARHKVVRLYGLFINNFVTKFYAYICILLTSLLISGRPIYK